MNYKKIIIPMLALSFLASCGSNSVTESSSESQAVIAPVETESDIAATTESVDDKSESTKENATTTISSAVTSESDTAGTTSGSSSTATATTLSVSVTTSTSSKAKTTSANAVTTKSDDTTVAQTTATEAVTEPESPFDEEFNLNDTPVINITSGGDYIVRGYAADGQIYIDAGTDEKVEITLDGVDLSCSYSSAILVNQCRRCVLKLADGSANYLRDSGDDSVNDGVIFSNDTIRIKGEGRLEITAGNAHGIASDDDVIIESGTYIINAVKSGIFAHDDITINGGNLNISGNTNGIKSKGTVNINGGSMYVSGGSKEEKSSIFASVAFYYTGGDVFAAGNKVTAPSSTPNPYIIVNYADGLPAGSSVGLVLNGAEKAVINPNNDFRCVLMLTPDIYSGSSFNSYLNGNSSEDFTVSDGQNIFTIE